jgi:3-oxoacyl-[acyl-carrier-protein] synthase I
MPIACISRAVSGHEPGHLYSDAPYRGDGLAATLSQLVALGSSFFPVAEVYSSMNGESHWAKEWGVAYTRNRATIQPGYRMHHPAECFGDTGAASGPLMIALAALGIRGGYRQPPILICGSSDWGGRAAVVVSTY